MGLYYFNVRDEFGLIADEDGIEFSDEAALLLEAIRSMDEFLRDTPAFSQLRLEVTDMKGRTVFMTPIRHRSETWNYLSNLSALSVDMQ